MRGWPEEGTLGKRAHQLDGSTLKRPATYPNRRLFSTLADKHSEDRLTNENGVRPDLSFD